MQKWPNMQTCCARGFGTRFFIWLLQRIHGSKNWCKSDIARHHHGAAQAWLLWGQFLSWRRFIRICWRRIHASWKESIYPLQSECFSFRIFSDVRQQLQHTDRRRILWTFLWRNVRVLKSPLLNSVTKQSRYTIANIENLPEATALADKMFTQNSYKTYNSPSFELKLLECRFRAFMLHLLIAEKTAALPY